MAGALGGMTDRQHLEAAAEQGMGGVGHLDHFGIELGWVLEGGIMLLSRLTPLTADGWASSSSTGSPTEEYSA